jgi:hypothetical protein
VYPNKHLLHLLTTTEESSLSYRLRDRRFRSAEAARGLWNSTVVEPRNSADLRNKVTLRCSWRHKHLDDGREIATDLPL